MTVLENIPFRRSIQTAMTVAILAVLWHLVDGGTALRQLGGANPAWIGAALLALTLQTLLSALRWKTTAARLGIVFDASFAIREYYLSQIVNQALPGGVLGDAGRAIRARAEGGLLPSGQAVLFERLAGQIALFAVFAVGVAGTQLVPGGFDGPRWILEVTLVALLFAGAAIFVTSACLPAGSLRTIRTSLEAFRHSVAAPDVRLRQCATSLGTALCNIAAFACCAAAIGEPLSIPAALVLIPVVLLSMLIPLTFGGWGVREGAAAALLPLAGATGAGALAASIAFGVAFIIATWLGLGAFALAGRVDLLKT